MMKRAVRIVAKTVAVILLAFVFTLALTGVSPIYDFESPRPFSGPDIYNPYSCITDSTVFKRANFHTHTRVKGILNESEWWPEQVLEGYDKLGYDILTFSNHHEITPYATAEHPAVSVYEHGYNFFKYHLLVFGSEKVSFYDNLLPILPSQRQFKMDLLGKRSDIIQLNHPVRTNLTTENVLKKLSGYGLFEIDSGMTVENEMWDQALTAGHYVFALANDDSHHVDVTSATAIRCNWLDTPSANWDDILATFRKGAFYSMSVYDFGDGDWNVKYEKNRRLPKLKRVEVDSDTVRISFDRPFSRLDARGAGHKLLASAEDSDVMEMVLDENEPYVRFTAFFNDWGILYTNPLARYDASKSNMPVSVTGHTVNWPLTILFNLFLIALMGACVWAGILLIKWGKNPEGRRNDLDVKGV